MSSNTSSVIKELSEARHSLKLISPGEVRVRMAPSPTGPFHIGSARTALFNYLFARKNKGSFILRIEDTDKERSKPEWEDNIRESLQWLFLDCDESPDRGGPFGPYRQSERTEIYEHYIQRLLKSQNLYYCFCSEQDLEVHRQYLMSQGKAPVYSKKCRSLSQAEVKKNLADKKPFVLRFKMPAKNVRFYDILRGEIEQDSYFFGDIVAAKDERTPLYNLACVIDDFEMKISHVIRGEEHISNTPRQILLAESLDIVPPKYLHLPLILNQKRAKLSKRDPSINALVLDYKKQGYLPEAMINFLAFLGWNPGDNREIFSLSSLIQEFSVENIQISGAVFNLQKLDWINGFYIRQKSKEKIAELCLPYLISEGFILPAWGWKLEEKIGGQYTAPFDVADFLVSLTQESISFEKIKNIVGLYQERLKKLSEIAQLADYFFKKDLNYEKDLLRWKEMADEDITKSLDKLLDVLQGINRKRWTKENLEKILLPEAEKFKTKDGKIGDRGKLLWPLRVALSGKGASAGPFEIAEALGKEKTIERIQQAKERFKI